jgi:crossover junction endodeoxyribonuclease RuvC
MEESMKLFLGIDPGQSGGMALLDEEGRVVNVFPMPETEKDVVEVLFEYGSQIQMAVLEKVGPMPRQGISSTAKFMQGYGLLRGVLLALNIRFDDARPQVWQKAMGCMTGGDKNVSKAKAQQLFPSMKVTHALADALLIAEHCRRSYR